MNYWKKSDSVLQLEGGRIAIGGCAYCSWGTRVLQLGDMAGHGFSCCGDAVAGYAGLWLFAVGEKIGCRKMYAVGWPLLVLWIWQWHGVTAGCSMPCII